MSVREFGAGECSSNRKHRFMFDPCAGKGLLMFHQRKMSRQRKLGCVVGLMLSALMFSLPAVAADSESSPPTTAPSAPTNAGTAPAGSSAPAGSDRTAGVAYAEAKAKVATEDWAGALALLEEADRLQPNNADTNNLLGFVHRKLGKMDRSFTFYQRALTIDPKHKGALEYLGELYLMQNQPTKAKTQLGKLKVVCGGTGCEEYQDLQKAISAFKPPKPAKSAKTVAQNKKK
jgi:Tetratricopeptide repeat